MSAAPAFSLVLPTALAVSQPSEPPSTPAVLEGMAFRRKDTLKLLQRYLQTSMMLGRAPCLLGNVVFRGRVSSHQIPSFEDAAIFIFDVEKCLKQLDRFSQTVVAHMALEDYTAPEAALLTRESLRTIYRVWGAALDRLTELFTEYELFDRAVENLSRGVSP